MDAITSLQKKLQRRKIPALIISNPENRRFLSGYTAHQEAITESSGFLLIPAKGTSFLFTDSRYTLQAQNDCPDLELVIYNKGFFVSLSKTLRSLGLKSVAFESDYFLFSQAEQLRKLCRKDGIKLQPSKNLATDIRLQKNASDLALIEKSVALNEQVFQEVFPNIRAGLSEIDIALMIESKMRQLGAERPSFSTIVASGPNGALPHATPGNRLIQLSEPIVIDMGLVLNGLCSDMTRTIVLGPPNDFTCEIFSIVREAQLAAAMALCPGVTCASIDKIARDIISSHGYGKEFGHALGHGVGYAIHEAPAVCSRSRKKLRPNMVLTVEPGIYIPGWGGVRLENMYSITEDGSKLLNRDLTCLNLGQNQRR